MFFFRLGLINARRNLSRSVFAIIAMSIAAGFLSYCIGLSRGYTKMLKADARAVVGGEVVAYARQIEGRIPENESSWTHQWLPSSPLSDIAVFHPELLRAGYLSSGSTKTSFSTQDIEQMNHVSAEVTGIYPRYQISAKNVSLPERRPTPLHGRDPEFDRLLIKSPEELLQAGRWFTPEDNGKLVAVVSTTQTVPREAIPKIGDTIRLALPSIVYLDGEPVFREAQPIIKEFVVVGLIEAVTRYYGGEMTPILWELDEVQIPLETWRMLWQECGGQEYEPEQVTLLTAEMTHLEDVVNVMRDSLPQFSFFSIVEHFEQAERRGLIERLSSMQRSWVKESDFQMAMPLDLRMPFAAMIFFNSALVVASNLLILVSERRREIGVLKAVGATRFQVLLMVLSEAVAISSIGVCFGFIFFQIPTVLTQITNGWDLMAITAALLREAAVIYSVSAAFAILFGLLPGLHMSRLSVREVLSGD